MVRIDSMDEYNSEESINKVFMKHRKGVDHQNYRVGVSKDGNSVVFNPSNRKIMDYYFDDVSEEWFQLDIISDKFKGYKINRSGEVIGPRKKLSTQYDINGYAIVKIRGKYFRIHRLLSSIFIPNLNPKICTVVDHKDRNRVNNNLSNLRWCSIKENANNINRPKFSGKLKYNLYEDKNRKTLIDSLSNFEFYKKYPDKKFKGRVSHSISRNTRFDGFYWEIIDLDLEDYLKKFDIKEIKEDLWVLHYSGKFFVHPTGLIKYCKGKKSITPGTLDYTSSRQERRVHGGKRVHVAVAEVFLNGNSPIKNKLVVDHLNTDPSDNRAVNLRICSQKENMTNPITLKRLSRKVSDINGKVFNSITECAKYYKVTTACIWSRLNGIRPSRGFSYI